MIKTLRETIDDQAAAWVARSLSGAFSAEDEAAMTVWLAADNRHREAFDSYMHIANCASVAADSAAELSLENDLIQFAEKSAARRPWFIGVPAIAASIAAAAVFVVAVIDTGESYSTYATLRGETEEINLADGTVIALNTDTEIQVEIDSNRRSVRLIKGEALFDVARDPQRPFVVTSSIAETSVLGTSFNIYEKDDETIVSVFSGVVDVASKLVNDSAVTLIAGQEVAIDEDYGQQEIRIFQPAAVTSWRRGLAYHENTPLSEVIADLNRYFSIELALGDSTLNDIPVTGGFDTKDQSVAVEALSIALSLRAESESDSRIVLYPDD